MTQMLLIHLLYAYIRFKFVESELLKEGNMQVLNGLEEGVIIFEETTYE